MKTTGWTTLCSSLLSVMLHIIIGGLLIVSFEFAPAPPAPVPAGNVIQAVSVDKERVQHEIQRLQDLEKEKVNKERERQQRLEKEAAELRQKRINEEKKLAKIEKQKRQEQLKREREELILKKLEREKQEIEKERRQEEIKKQQVEQERRQLEKEKQEKEAELKRIEEEKRQAEEERILQEAIAAEQEILDAAQRKRDQSELSRYSGLIVNAITHKFNRLGLEETLSCVLSIRMNRAGEVTEAVIVETSGNVLFDRRAISAVYAAAPLPVPSEQRLFEKIRVLTVTFDPE